MNSRKRLEIKEKKEETGRERERDSQWNKRAFFVQVEEVGVVVGKNQKRKSKKDGDDVAAAAAVLMLWLVFTCHFFYSFSIASGG